MIERRWERKKEKVRLGKQRGKGKKQKRNDTIKVSAKTSAMKIMKWQVSKKERETE